MRYLRVGEGWAYTCRSDFLALGMLECMLGRVDGNGTILHCHGGRFDELLEVVKGEYELHEHREEEGLVCSSLEPWFWLANG